MGLKRETLLKLLLLMLVLSALFVSGCREVYLRNPFSTSPPIVVYPIEGTDIFSIPKGAQVEWDDMNDLAGDLIFVEKDGWFISDFYMQEIMQARIE